MSSRTYYVCDHCFSQFKEDTRTNIRGELRIEAAGLGEKVIEVNLDLCFQCREKMIQDGAVTVPTGRNFEVVFET